MRIRKLTAVALLALLVACGHAAAFEVYDTVHEALSAPEDVLLDCRRLTEGPTHHWFGYYDVNQFGPEQEKVLAMAVDFEGRSPRPDDAVEVGIVDLSQGKKWQALGTSRAWCWQQGCRLQWRPGHPHQVMWNDRRDGKLICRIMDVRDGETRIIPHPIYHVTPDGTWGLGLNFARLQDMRPGYGYVGVEDEYADVNAPEESGVYRVNLDTGEKKLILPTSTIARIRLEEWPARHKLYFNHIMWNTDGSRFMVFSRGEGVGTKVYTADPEGKDVRLLSAQGASHYDWRDPRQALIWGRGAHRLYVDDGTANNRVLWKSPNGHCQYLPGDEWILTDTYPRGSERMQHIYLYHVPTEKYIPLGRFHLPKSYSGEWRCDLHPRLSPDGTKVVFDSPHGGDGRQLWMIDIAPVLAGYPEDL